MNILLIYSLLAAFLVGTSDFFSRYHTARYSSVCTVLMVMGASSLFLGGLYIWQGEGRYPDNIEGWIGIAIAGAMNAGALICLYEALKRGPISVASPLITLSVLFLSFLWFLQGVMPSKVTFLGIFLSMIGAMMIGYASPKDRNMSINRKYIMVTIGLAMGAAFLLAIRLFMIQNYAANIGNIPSLALMRFFSFITMLIIGGIYVFVQKKSFLKQGNFSFKDFKIPIFQGGIESSGILLLVMASVGVYRVAAPAIFSFFCVVTTLWAVILLKEKISKLRICGIITILIGVISIELG